MQNPILDIGRGESLVLPPRKTLVGGLAFSHFFSNPGTHPYDEFKWEERCVSIMDYAKNKPSFLRDNVEVPSHWSDNSVRITAAKYLFGSKEGDPEYEDSFRHPFDRIANTYTVWGWKNGYFLGIEDAKAYNWELKAMLVRQIWAPNSPVWFNIGHWEQWRWGRADLRETYSHKGNKAYKAFETGEGAIEIKEIPNSLEHPQMSACFLTEIGDSMESILAHGVTEGRIFSSGSGVGVNISTLRSTREPIAGRGRSSGPISFNKGWDRMAGAIKSGGRSRRAARMVIMDSDHPDIFSFIGLKNSQEQLAKVILREHNSKVALEKMAKEKGGGGDAEKLVEAILGTMPAVNNKEYDGGMDGEVYGETVSDQNANHSVSLRGDYWKEYWSDGNYSTRWVTHPDRIQESFKAKKLLEAMAEAVYHNAEPGCHNNDYINLWSPIKSRGRINTSNPCSEYLHANNTSCNLASFNAYRLLKDGRIDKDFLRAAVRLAMVAADLNVEEGGFPIPEIAEWTYRYRTTGIGFGNIGGLLMALGIPYDSDEGRYIAGLLTSELTAGCWEASAEMGRELGAYREWSDTVGDLSGVIRLHALCHNLLLRVPEMGTGELGIDEAIDQVLEGVATEELPRAEGLSGLDALKALVRSFALSGQWDAGRLRAAGELGQKTWEAVDAGAPMRNSFTSLYAPMGTISAPLGIYDEGTTSAEPDYTLVKYKSLSGGGTITMFNSLALTGLKVMGYDEFRVREAALEVAGVSGLIVACSEDRRKASNHLRQILDDDQKGPVRRVFDEFMGTGDRGEIVALLDGDSLPALVRSGTGNVEGIPWLPPHHKDVFDCAATTSGGTRAIPPSGHIRMLGALAPFISGAVSKTVNLPHYATVDEIVRCFEMSHQMGVKCIALYRAGSKGVSVFAADDPEAAKWNPQTVWDDMVGAVKGGAEEIRKDASKPRRKKMPGRREGQIIKFEIGGSLDGFLIIGTYPDGRCGEVFGRLGKCGSFAHGMFESFCKAFSVMLQWGVPLDKAIGSFRNLAFDPSGFARVGDMGEETDVKSCKSVVDLMMRILEWLFPAESGYRLRGAAVTPDCLREGESATVLNVTSESTEGGDGVGVGPSDLGAAEMCPECHSLSVIQDGKCKRCVNCGFSNGGCGG